MTTSFCRNHVVVLAACFLLVLSGCQGDPNVKKQKYLDSGNRFSENKQYQEAVIEYRNAIQLDPQFAEAHYRLAKTYLALKNWGGALAELQTTVSLEPSNLQAQLDLGNFYLGAHKFQDAEQIALVVLEKDPNNADGHVLAGSIYSAQHKLVQAQSEFDKALQLAPDNASVQFAAGMFATHKGDTDSAANRFKKAIELDPKLALARTALADLYIAEQNFDAAETALRDGINADPKSVALYKSLARFYELRHRRSDAVKVLTDAKNSPAGDASGYRALAEFYLGVGDTKNALEEYASLVKEYPKDRIARITYIELLASTNQLDEASEQIEGMLKEDSRDQQALVLKAGVLNLQHKNADALALLQPIAKQLADNPAFHLQAGNAYNGLGQVSQAESEWRESARLSPDLLEARVNLAVLALQKNDSDLLRNSADKIIQLRPSAPAGYLFRASAESLQHDFASAETDLKKAIALAPYSPDGYSKLGTLRGLQKRYSEAEQLFETALQKDPNSGEALAGLISTYEIEKKPTAKAIARINAQITKVPQNDFFWVILGKTQTSAGDKKAAKASFEKALTISNVNSAALTLLAQLQVSTGDLAGAATSYQNLIDVNPRSATPLIMLGTLEESRGNLDQAQQLYKKALDVDPNQPVAANNLAYLMMEHGGNLDVALSLAQAAVRGMPNNPSAADTLGWAYYHKGVYGSARDVLESASKAAPENAAIQYHLGMTYSKIVDRGKAIEHFKKVLQLSPNGPYAIAAKQALSTSSMPAN